MPIYEYACQSCGYEFETLQKISEAPLVDCPSCGAAELRKKVSAARFRLKGGGWYETDFKSGDKKNLAGESSRESAAGKESSAAKGSPGGAESNGEKASSAPSGDAKTSNGAAGKASDGGSTSSD